MFKRIFTFIGFLLFLMVATLMATSENSLYPVDAIAVADGLAIDLFDDVTVPGVAVTGTAERHSIEQIIVVPLFSQFDLVDGDVQHITISGASFIAVEQSSYRLVKDKDQSRQIALLVALSIGLAKEGYDSFDRDSQSSFHDIWMNCLGISLSVAINESFNWIVGRNVKEVNFDVLMPKAVIVPGVLVRNRGSGLWKNTDPAWP